MTSSPVRMTSSTRTVLEALLDEPDIARYGLELGAMTGLPSGTIHPILARLEGVGWLVSSWEEIDPAIAGRPRRRHYRLTAAGLAAARTAVAAAAARRERLTARWGGSRLSPGSVRS